MKITAVEAMILFSERRYTKQQGLEVSAAPSGSSRPKTVLRQEFADCVWTHSRYSPLPPVRSSGLGSDQSFNNCKLQLDVVALKRLDPAARGIQTAVRKEILCHAGVVEDEVAACNWLFEVWNVQFLELCPLGN